MLSLFKSRYFTPLWATLFLGAFNDNLLKNALTIYVTYLAIPSITSNADYWVNIATVLFIAPYILFSSFCGMLANRYDRALIARTSKQLECLLMMLAAVGFLMEHLGVLLVALFCMGAQSTLFAPVKYALLPQHLPKEQLVLGNGWVEFGTFLAILSGTLMGNILILQSHGNMLCATMLVLLAFSGWRASVYIPVAPVPEDAERHYQSVLKVAWNTPHMRPPLLAMGWFWLIGAGFIAQFSVMVRDNLRAEGSAVSLLLSVFTLGIGVGSFLSAIMARGKVRLNHAWWGGVGLGIFTLDAAYTAMIIPPSEVLRPMSILLSTSWGWRIMLDLLFISLCAGIYNVPIQTYIQAKSPAASRAQVIAGSNILNALFMVMGAGVSMAIHYLGGDSSTIFIVLGVGCLLVCLLLARTMLRYECDGEWG